MSAYTVQQIKQLLDLNSLRLTSRLISIEEFDERKLEIMRLPRQSVASYERHGADCVFCKEEEAKPVSMDNGMLVHQGTGKPIERKGHIRI
jgi:hypothetical protein